MILENEVRQVFTTGVETTTRMNISAEIESHIIKLVTENSYRDALGSGIREAVSNSLDSMVESGNTDPVIVSLKQTSNEKWEFSSQDTGLGLDDVGFHKYIMGIGESSKRLSASLLGGYGLGSKAFLAYTNSYTYLCRKDGIERKYLIFKGAEFPESMLIHENPTTEPNGVTITVELGTGWNEYRNCVEAVKKQLAYLPNVYFDIEGVDNKYKIFQNDLFQWNTLQPVAEMHISLKNIFYPIDFKALGIPTIFLPVALRFDNYDDLHPVFNREELKYDEKAKTAIKKKIEEVCNFFINKYNEDVQLIKLAELPAKFNLLNPDTSKTVTIEGLEFVVGGLEKYGSIKFASPKIEGIEVMNISQLWSNRNFYLLDDYHVVANTSQGKCATTRAVQGQNSFIALSGKGDYRDDYKKWIIAKETPKGVLGQFLADSLGRNTVVLVQRPATRNLRFFKQNWYLKNYPKKDWRKFIEEYYKIRQVFINKLEPIENFPITEEWKTERKANRKSSGTVSRTHVKKEEVNLRRVKYGSNKYILGTGEIVEVAELKNTDLCIYGLKEDKEDMEKIVSNDLGIDCYVTSERDVERIKAAALSNWITYAEFMEGNTERFKTITIPHKRYAQYYELSSSNGKFIAEIDKDFANVRNQIYTEREHRIDNDWVKQYLVLIAQLKDWWQDELDDKYEECMNKLNNVDLSFLNYISISRQEGMDIAKEVYFTRIEKQKQTFNNLNPRYV